MNKLECKLKIHSKAEHLNQIYTGFIELQQKGFLDIKLDLDINSKEHILEAIVNDNIRLIYDTFDEGWKYSSKVDITDVDFYFKRSYNSDIHAEKSKKIMPLGLNYNVYSKNGNLLGNKEAILNKLKKMVKNKKSDFLIDDFEYYPNITDNPQICFLTRMWNPNGNEVENNIVKKERIEINEFRSACIRECRKAFGRKFIGGIEDSEFSRRYFSDCIVEDLSVTKRFNFLNMVKNSEICIATTGLHKSIGWKFGEYVAASRAIVTEPLFYQLPGTFTNKANYLQFSTVDELLRAIDILNRDKEYRFNMMANNCNYYNNYVRADKLVMNTLLIAMRSNISSENSKCNA